jgi:hypothetical protein
MPHRNTRLPLTVPWFYDDSLQQLFTCYSGFNFERGLRIPRKRAERELRPCDPIYAAGEYGSRWHLSSERPIA